MNNHGAMEGFRRSLAFLIAIDGYGNGVPELRSPVADAKGLAEVLRQDHGFETEVVANEQATLAGVREFLAHLPNRVGSDDRVLFYFAGHGIALESDEGPKGYVLPQDADSPCRPYGLDDRRWPGRFDAFHGDRLLVERTRTPFCDGARPQTNPRPACSHIAEEPAVAGVVGSKHGRTRYSETVSGGPP
jgi:hypothetical protein